MLPVASISSTRLSVNDGCRLRLGRTIAICRSPLYLCKRGLMAAYQSAYKMWDRSRRHSEDRQVSIKE